MYKQYITGNIRPIQISSDALLEISDQYECKIEKAECKLLEY